MNEMTAGASPAEQIRAKALDLGFDAIGFAPASLGPEARERLGAFIAAGQHGDMGWLAERTQERSHPQALWAEARSVIALGLSYAPEGDPLASHTSGRPGQHLRLCAASGLSRPGERHAEASGAIHRQPVRTGGQGVRRHRPRDGKAARRVRRVGLAGQAYQLGIAHPWLLAVPRRNLHQPGLAAGPAACRSLRHVHAMPDPPAQPTPSPRPTAWMRRAAFPTSPSSIGGPSHMRCGR